MELKARDVSLWAKIVGVVVILVFATLSGLGILSKMNPVDSIWIGLGVAGIFGTVDLNLIVDKLTGRRQGGVG